MPYKVKFFGFQPTVVDQHFNPVANSSVLKVEFGENAVFTVVGTSYVLSGAATATIDVAGKQYQITLP
jgi:hypothetical protein